MKFLHAADLHLDSPLEGLERYEGAPVESIRGATRGALSRLVDLALEEQVAFVVIAGDLYDGDWKDYHTGLHFAKQMARLREPGIPVFLVAGNHDAASVLTRRLQLPKHVRLLAESAAETILLEAHGVALHGQSFPTRWVKDDLSAAYPQRIPGLFNLGLLHTSANGRPGHETYAPCSVGGLVAKGYDYWALGHVHTREVLHRDPWIVFAGNTQGRNFRETGEKGVTLVTVEDGRVTDVALRQTDVLRWSVCTIDAEGVESGEGVLERVSEALQAEKARAGGRPLALRVRLVGPCEAHPELCGQPERWRAEIRNLATELGDLWIEKVGLETSHPHDTAAFLQRDVPLARLIRSIVEMESRPELLGELMGELSELKRKLPAELHQNGELAALATDEQRRACLEEVRQLLLPRLLSLPEAQ